MKNAARLLLKSLVWIEQYLLIAAYVLIPVLIVIEAFSRYLMRAAVIGIEEICLLIVAYAYYLGAAYATKKKDHITVRVLHLLPLSPKLVVFSKYLTTFLSLVCATSVTWFLIRYFLFVAKSPGLYSPFNFHKVYYVAGPTIGWILICAYTLADGDQHCPRRPPGGKTTC